MKYSITSKTARASLAPKREPYWARVSKGLHLGYRKSAQGDGTWIARHTESGTNTKKYLALGTFVDDHQGKAFDEAVKTTKAWGESIDQGVDHRPISITDACKAYVDHLRIQKSAGAAQDAEGRFKRLVYTANIGRIQLAKLRTTDVKRWRDAQVDLDDPDADDEDIRRSKDSANRNLNSFKAALNLALKDRLVASDAGWKTVTAFRGVGRRRTEYLDIKERQALIAACPDDLAALVKAMLLTGARPSELARLTVADFNKTQGTIELNRHVNGKTGHRIATISTGAIKFFSEQAKGKIGNALLIPRADGLPWDKDAWKGKLGKEGKGGFRAAVTAAGLSDKIVMYTLRHVAISEQVASGIDSAIVARLAGTSVAMIEKHYGHLQHKRVRDQLDAVKMI